MSDKLPTVEEHLEALMDADHEQTPQLQRARDRAIAEAAWVKGAMFGDKWCGRAHVVGGVARYRPTWGEIIDARIADVDFLLGADDD